MATNKKILESHLQYLEKELDKVEHTDNSYRQQATLLEEIDHIKAELIKIEVKERLKKIQEYEKYQPQCRDL